MCVEFVVAWFVTCFAVQRKSVIPIYPSPSSPPTLHIFIYETPTKQNDTLSEHPTPRPAACRGTKATPLDITSTSPWRGTCIALARHLHRLGEALASPWRGTCFPLARHLHRLGALPTPYQRHDRPSRHTDYTLIKDKKCGYLYIGSRKSIIFALYFYLHQRH